MVKLFANPVLLRAAFVLFCAGSAFLMGILFIRLLRKSIAEDAEVSSDAKPSLDAMPMHVYNTVIQQLKQQKHELQEQSQAEQRRARTSDMFSQAVMQNLSCGVLVFGTNGLVQQSNPAAKEILGFASPGGMSAEDIFRWTVIASPSAQATVASDAPNEDNAAALADAVLATLQPNGVRRQVEADYMTPAEDYRHLAVTISPISSTDGSLLGAACLIDDHTELNQLRRQKNLSGGISNKSVAAGSVS